MIALFDSTTDPAWERRQDRRYECHLPLRYRSGQGPNGGAGTATDISRNGIAVNIPQTLAQGSSVELLLDWPSSTEEVGKVSLLILGQVIRSDFGRTAIAIERREFVRDRFSALHRATDAIEKPAPFGSRPEPRSSPSELETPEPLAMR